MLKPKNKTLQYILHYTDYAILIAMLLIFKWWLWLLSKFRYIPGAQLATTFFYSIYKLYKTWTSDKSTAEKVFATAIIVVTSGLIMAALIGNIILHGVFLSGPILFVTATSIFAAASIMKLVNNIKNYKTAEDKAAAGAKIATSAVNTVFSVGMPVALALFLIASTPLVHPVFHAVVGIVLVSWAIAFGVFQLGKMIHKEYQKSKKTNLLLNQSIDENENVRKNTMLLGNQDKNETGDNLVETEKEHQETLHLLDNNTQSNQTPIFANYLGNNKFGGFTASHAYPKSVPSYE